MKTITIRLEDDIFNRIEERRGKKSKSDFYREIIEYSLNTGEDEVNDSEYEKIQDDYKSLQNEYEKLQDEYDLLKKESQHRKSIENIQIERIKDLQNQVGFLQLEFSKLNDRILLPGPKKWWEVWK